MENDLQQTLFQLIKEKFNDSGNPIWEVMKALSLTKSQAYRRMNGSVDLTFKEAATLADYFEIPLHIFENHQNKNADFHNFNASLKRNQSPQAYLKHLKNVLEPVALGDNPLIYLATDEFPIFYSFHFSELAMFKFYMWERTFWKTKGKKSKFSIDDVHPDDVMLLRELSELYLSVPSYEYWNNRLSDNTILQLKFAMESNWFKNKSDIEVLIAQLVETVDMVEAMATNGNKALGKHQESKHIDFQLFITELPTNIHYLVHYDEHRVLFSTFDKPNFLSIDNYWACKYMNGWLNNLREKSTRISNTGIKERNVFFNRLKEKINTLKLSVL